MSDGRIAESEVTTSLKEVLTTNITNIRTNQDSRYLGFTEQDFDSMLNNKRNASSIGEVTRLQDLEYEARQIRQTSGRRLAVVSADSSSYFAGRYFYIMGSGDSGQIVGNFYNYAEPFTDGYALVMRDTTVASGYQFINENAQFSDFLTEERAEGVDPAQLKYYDSEFDMYLDNRIDVDQLPWHYFDGGLSYLEQIMEHEENNCRQELGYCRTTDQQAIVRERYGDLSEWIKSVSYMVTYPQDYADRLSREDEIRQQRELDANAEALMADPLF